MTSKHLRQTSDRGRSPRLAVALSTVGAVAVAGAVGVLQLADEPSGGSIALSNAPVPAGAPSWTPSPTPTPTLTSAAEDNQEFLVTPSAATPSSRRAAIGAKVTHRSVPKVVATRVRVKIPVRTSFPVVPVLPPTSRPTPATPTTSKSAPSATPTPSTPAASPTSTSPGANSSFAQQVVDLTNKERLSNGCRPLTVDPTLTAVAQAHSADMAARNFFEHNNPDGKSPFDRMTAAGYRYRMAAENIAAGYPTAQAVVTGWMNSPGHRANIVNCGLTQIGVGYVSGGARGPYWTQDFGTPA